MGYKEDDNNEEDGEDMLVILDVDVFVKEVYLFSLLNLDVALLPEVHAVKDQAQKDKLKEEIMASMSIEELDPLETEEMIKVLPLSYAKDLLIPKILKNDENELFIRVVELMEVVSSISRKMLYCIFDKMHKEGLVDLYWDEKKGDFAYGLKKSIQKEIIDECLKEKKKESKKKQPVKRKKK